MTPEEVQKYREWSGRLKGWALQPYQYGCIPGNVRMSWVSIQNGTLNREYLEDEWRPDKDLNQAFMVVERMRELGWWTGFELRQGCVSGKWTGMWPIERGVWKIGIEADNPAYAIGKAAMATGEGK